MYKGKNFIYKALFTTECSIQGFFNYNEGTKYKGKKVYIQYYNAYIIIFSYHRPSETGIGHREWGSDLRSNIPEEKKKKSKRQHIDYRRRSKRIMVLIIKSPPTRCPL